MKLRTRLLSAVGVLSVAGAMLVTAAPAGATPSSAGSCQGAAVPGAGAPQLALLETISPGLTDQTRMQTASIKGLKEASPAFTATPQFLGGLCTGLLSDPQSTLGTPPGTLTPKSISAKLSGSASCAVSAADRSVDANNADAIYAPSGKLSIVTTTLDSEAVPHPWSIQAYITVLGQRGGDFSDAFDIGGVVLKGADVGASVSGSLWQDPAVKLAKTDLEYPGWDNTGYGIDNTSANVLDCANGTADNGMTPITTWIMGDRTSPLGQSTTGLNFSYGE